MYSIWSEFFCWVTCLEHIIQKKKWYRHLDFKDYFALIIQFYGEEIVSSLHGLSAGFCLPKCTVQQCRVVGLVSITVCCL